MASAIIVHVRVPTPALIDARWWGMIKALRTRVGPRGKIALVHLALVVFLYVLVRDGMFSGEGVEDVIERTLAVLICPIAFLAIAASLYWNLLEYSLLLALLVIFVSLPVNSYLWAFVVTRLARWCLKKYGNRP
jgi:hypothetical protein